MMSRLKIYSACALLGALVSMALIGAVTFSMSTLGYFGVGHFRLYYGGDPAGCTKMEYAMAQLKEVSK